MKSVLINIDTKEISEFFISVVVLNSPINPAPTASANRSDINTIPNAILMLFFLSKVINYVWFSW